MGLRRSVPMILAAVMLLRAMIPAGFMPDLSAAGLGRFEIVICTGEGARTIPVDPDGAASPDHGSPRGDHGFEPCAFALAMAGALVVLGFIVTLSFYRPSRAFVPPSIERLAFACAAGALGPRAPPIP